MVSNIGKITDLAATPSKGLVDGTDKLHSGIIKVLESFAQGDMIYSHGGFTITDGGSFTQYNLNSTIKFISKGQYVSYTGANLTVAYTSSPVQSPTNSRYDWVLLNPNIGGSPSIVIVQGTAGTTPLVSDITAGYIPVALVHIVAGTDDDKTDYSFQTYTMNVAKNSLSIGRSDSGYTESLSIVSSNAGDANDGDITIKSLEQDADIIFNVNDGGSDSQVLRMFGATKNVYVTGPLTLGANAGFSISESSDDVTIKNIITDKDVIFNINDGGSDVEVMRVQGSTQRVAIGNTSPDEKLHVTGNVKITNDLTLGGGDISIGNGQDATIKVDATTSTTAGRDLTIEAGSTSTGSNNIDGGDLHLKSGGGDGTGTSVMTFSTKASGVDAVAERMRIHTTGNVGIGTTTPTEKLSVSGGVGAAAYLGSVTEVTGNPLPSAGLTANPNTGNPCLELSSETHRTIIADTQTTSPGPPPSGGPLSLLLPAASGTHQGWEMRIIAKNNAGGANNLTLDVTGGSDVIIDATGATVGNASAGLTLATGKIYTVIHISTTQYMAIVLN